MTDDKDTAGFDLRRGSVLAPRPYHQPESWLCCCAVGARSLPKILLLVVRPWCENIAGCQGERSEWGGCFLDRLLNFSAVAQHGASLVRPWCGCQRSESMQVVFLGPTAQFFVVARTKSGSDRGSAHSLTLVLFLSLRQRRSSPLCTPCEPAPFGKRQPSSELLPLLTRFQHSNLLAVRACLCRSGGLRHHRGPRERRKESGDESLWMNEPDENKKSRNRI